MLIGDLNSRTATKTDMVAPDIGKVPMVDDPLCVAPIDQPRRSEDGKTNPHGNHLLELCMAMDLRILNGRTLGDTVGKFTCHQTQGSSVVDYVLVQGELMDMMAYFKVHDWLAYMSDHCMISTALRSRIPNAPCDDTIKPERCRINKYKWDKEAINRYQTLMASQEIQKRLESCVPAEKTAQEVNNAVKSFNDTLIFVADETLVKCKDVKIQPNRPVSKKWYTQECKQMKKVIHSKGKELQKSPTDQQLRAEFYQQKKSYKKLVRRSKRGHKDNLISELEAIEQKDTKQFWRLLKDLRDLDNDKADPADGIKLPKWHNHFSKLFSQNPNRPKIQGYHRDYNPETGDYTTEHPLDQDITTSEVTKALNALKMGKAIGMDSISNELLKYGCNSISNTLQDLFNAILKSGIYPDIWSISYIKPIYKAGSRSQPDNYRGISISSCVAKLYSMILNNRLQTILKDQEIIKEEQIGFKEGARTSDHIFVLKTAVDSYIKKRRCVYSCFIDLKKAFDSVWREAMFDKMAKLKLGETFLTAVKAMYNNVRCCVKTKEGFSPPFRSYAGVKQGDPISPNLFNLFLNDVPELFDNACEPLIINNRKLSCLMYADDIVLFSETRDGLQECLDRFSRYCDTWGLEVNTDKSKVVTFSLGGKVQGDAFRLKGRYLDSAKSYRYLGIEISNNGGFGEAKTYLTNRASRACFLLKQVTKDLSPRLAIKLFHQFITPILLYGAEVWGLCGRAKVLKSLEALPADKVHLSFCKFVLGINKKASNLATRGELGAYPLYITVAKTLLKYWKRLKSCPHESLLGQAYAVSVAQEKAGSWYSTVTKLSQLCNIDIRVADEQVIPQALQLDYRKRWAQQLQTSSKLDLYNELVTDFSSRAYLCEVTNRKHRQAISKIRTSAHPLAVETGRYIRPPVERSKRICKICTMDIMEDEEHFLTMCPIYAAGRLELNNGVSNLCPNYIQLNNRAKTIYLLTAEGKVSQLAAQFCHRALESRYDTIRT